MVTTGSFISYFLLLVSPFSSIFSGPNPSACMLHTLTQIFGATVGVLVEEAVSTFHFTFLTKFDNFETNQSSFSGSNQQDYEIARQELDFR